MDKLRLTFIWTVLGGLATGFGHEVYGAFKGAGDPGPVLRGLAENWYKSPPLMCVLGVVIGYIIACPHGGGK